MHGDHARDLPLALAGALILLATPLAVAAAPDGARGAAFIGALGIGAALALWGGARARRAVASGAPGRASSIAAALIGLTFGVTAAIFAVWTLVGLVL